MVKRILLLPAAGLLALGLTSSMAAAELVPPEPDLNGIVKSGSGKHWAIALGRALFWDEQVGSDGMACASCHFSAGADSRIVNQLNPGMLGITDRPEDEAFGAIEAHLPHLLGETASGAVARSNYELVPEDFPFHQLEDPLDRNSEVLISTNDVASSSGAYDNKFIRIKPGRLSDKCTDPSSDIFHAGAHAARMVEPRNTPTVINAAFFHRNFWDGRADDNFNGVTPFGQRDVVNDPTTRVLVRKSNGYATMAPLSIFKASLASQAVGPPLSNFEMGCENRAFRHIARKLLSWRTRPLKFQKVHSYDSVFRKGKLGNMRHWSRKGLRYSYASLIRKAFNSKYWSAKGRYVIKSDGSLKRTGGGYTQMEHNFALFMGISVMLYEQTLISDRSRFDSCAPVVQGPPQTSVAVCTKNPTMTKEELEGFDLFSGGFAPGDAGGRCVACHAPPLFSAAAYQEGEDFVPITRVNTDSGVPALHDTGFFNIGSTPTTEDLGVGGTDNHGDPLSMARVFLDEIDGKSVSDPTGITNPCDPRIIAPFGQPPFFPECGGDDVLDSPIDTSKLRVMSDGVHKTPGLRNVAMTPPYFHWGGYKDLESVMLFYDRGGSRIDLDATGDTSGSGPLGQSDLPLAGPPYGRNVDANIQPLGLGPENRSKIVAFLKTLTDHRVQCDKAPFDHPELRLPHGHRAKDANGNQKADDIMFRVPEVGYKGYPGDGKGHMCLPNKGDLFAKGLRNKLVPLKK